MDFNVTVVGGYKGINWGRNWDHYKSMHDT